jgi:micrococcal nuclease
MKRLTCMLLAAVLVLVCLSLSLATPPGWAAKYADGCVGSCHGEGTPLAADVTATVVSVHDGDTIVVDIPGWPAVVGERIGVRIRGIDAPELRAKSDHIRGLAFDARGLVIELCEVGSRIELQGVARDKYFRVLATVFCQGRDVAQELLARGLAKPYYGGTKTGWE